MSNSQQALSEDRIRAIAYGLWLEEGRPEGRAQHHWFKASELAVKETALPALDIGKQKRKPAARKAK